MFGLQEEFSYSAGYPYKSLPPEPFYTFNVNRSENQVAFELKIHDRPVQVLPESRFVYRFKHKEKPCIFNEIVRCTMKSSRCSDEIFSLRLQMKLNPPYLSPRSGISSRSDFIHDSGFIPTKADLVKKSHICPVDKCVIFSGKSHRFRYRCEAIRYIGICLTIANVDK